MGLHFINSASYDRKNQIKSIQISSLPDQEIVRRLMLRYKGRITRGTNPVLHEPEHISQIFKEISFKHKKYNIQCSGHNLSLVEYLTYRTKAGRRNSIIALDQEEVDHWIDIPLAPPVIHEKVFRPSTAKIDNGNLKISLSLDDFHPDDIYDHSGVVELWAQTEAEPDGWSEIPGGLVIEEQTDINESILEVVDDEVVFVIFQGKKSFSTVSIQLAGKEITNLADTRVLEEWSWENLQSYKFGEAKEMYGDVGLSTYPILVEGAPQVIDYFVGIDQRNQKDLSSPVKFTFSKKRKKIPYLFLGWNPG